MAAGGGGGQARRGGGGGWVNEHLSHKLNLFLSAGPYITGNAS